VANASAYTLASHPGYAPKWLNALGFVACLLLAFTLPPASVLTMTAVLAAGVAGRWLVLRLRRKLST
jgi:basic amino acid/polyamine antiporter, APA family